MSSSLIAAGLLVVLAAYIVYCRVTGYAVNVFTPFLLILVPSRFVLELLYIQLVGTSGTDRGYSIVYSAYVLEFLGLIFGFFAIRKTMVVRIPGFSPAVATPKYAWALLIFSFIIYFPIIAGNLDLIFSPREIYTQTRSGFGPLFFGSLAFAYLAYVAYLFCQYRSMVFNVCFLSAVIFNLFLHGNKAAIINIIFMYMLYKSYLGGIKISFASFIKSAIAVSIAIVGLFYVTLSDSMKEDFVLGVASYADYTRNAIKVIEDPPVTQYGRLTFENNIVSLVPRFIYPEKPKNFGTFFLAEYYYPEWFDADTGSPAFGFGVQFADFRELSVIYVLGWGILVGMLIKIFLNRLIDKRSPADFIMLMFFCGIPFIELGAGYQILPHLVLALVYVRFSLFFRTRKISKIVLPVTSIKN